MIGINSYSFGQGLKVSPLVNYHFGGRWIVKEGLLKMSPSASYGTALTIPTSSNTSIELSWLRQDSKVLIDYGMDVNENSFDATVEYLHVAITEELGLRYLRPFIAVGFGVFIFSPRSNRLTSDTKTSGFFMTGLKYYINERIGIRLQAQLLVPAGYGSKNLFCGSSRCEVARTAFLQGTIGGAVIFSFRKTK